MRRALTLVLAVAGVATCARLPSDEGEVERDLALVLRDDTDSARLAKLSLPAADPSLVPVDMSLGEWRPVGPRNYAGKVYDIAVSAQDASRVYAAYGAGGVWRIAPPAEPLRITGAAGENRAWNQVAAWASDDATVVIGTGALWSSSGLDTTMRVLLSRDGGGTWRDITPPGGGNNQVVQIAIDPLDWRRIYVLGQLALFRTDDGGTTWRTLYTLDVSGIADNGERWPDLAVNPQRFDDVILGQIAIGLRKSTDGGASWHDVGQQIVPRRAPALAWSAANANVVWLETWSVATGGTHELWRSLDAGETWSSRRVLSEFTQGRYDMSIATSPADAAIVVAANAGYAYSANAMQTYVSDYCCGHVDHSSVVFAPSNAQVVYVGSDQGVFRSTTGGTSASTFTRHDAGVATAHVFSFDVSSVAATRRAYANMGDYTNNFLGNIDGAPVDWTLTPGYEYMSAAVSPGDQQLFFTVGGGEALQRSVDRGTSWENVEFLAPVSREYAAPVAFSTANPAFVAVGDVEVRRSTVRGAAGSWAGIGPPAALTGGARLRRIAVAPTNPSVIYASGDFSSNLVFRTTNGGASWDSFTGVDYILDIAVDPLDATKLVISGPFDLRYCTQSGNSCVSRRANLAPPADVRLRRVLFDAATPGRIYGAGETGGAFVTHDGGFNWFRVARMLPALEVSELRLVADRLYASGEQGVWELRSGSYGQPAVPFPTATALANGGVRVDWPAVGSASSYFARRAGFGQSYAGIATGFTDVAAPIGVPSCYEVAARNAFGPSAFSAPACATAQLPADGLFANGFEG